MAWITDKMRNNLCLESPTRPVSGESRYLTSLWVFEREESNKEHVVSSSVDYPLATIYVGESCQKHDMPSRPFPDYNKKDDHGTSSTTLQKSRSRPAKVRFSISVIVFLLVKVKRWSCSRKRHGFSGKWWSCGKHRHLPCKSDFIYQAACLMVLLKRWRNKRIGHVIQNRDHPAVCENTSKPENTTKIVKSYLHGETSLVHASPKKTSVSNARVVNVKATFKDDMIKFSFKTSSSLLELEKKVVQRFKLKSRMFRLKYRDEDNDLILLACDADLHTLLRLSTSNSPIKLIILTNDSYTPLLLPEF